MEVKISGVSYITQKNSVVIEDTVEERSICSFTVLDLQNIYTFSKGQPVEVLEGDVVVFAGYIDTAIKKTLSGPTMAHDIKCVDQHYLADKRIIAKAYANATAGEIVEDILEDILSNEGVKGTTAQPTFTRNSVAYKSDGSQVAVNVPRYETGKFGKAVMIEEGTTNKFSLLQSQGRSPIVFSEATVTETQGQPDPFGGNNATRQQSSGGTHVLKFYYDSNVKTLGISASEQIWVRNRIETPLRLTSNLGNRTIDVLQSEGWKKVMWENIIGDGIGSIHFQFRTYNIADNIDCDIFHLQCEEKPYITSWVPGQVTRAAEALTVPTANVFYKGNWTIEQWFKPTGNQVRAGQYKRLWQVYIDVSNYSNLMVNPEGKAVLEIFSGGIQKVISSTIVLQEGLWYYFACRGNGATMALFVNGAKIDEISYAEPVGELPANIIKIGDSNGLTDDLRISSRARSDEEILAAYQSGKPLERDESTTYLMSFDDNLTAKTTIDLGPEITEAVFNYTSVARAIESLAEKAGYTWYIDYNKWLYFIEKTTIAAPFSVSSKDMLKGSISVTSDNPQYRNTQYVRGGRDITDDLTELKKGDGATRSWVLGFPCAMEPSISLNGTPISASDIGIRGVEKNKKFYWSKGSNTINQDESETLLTTSDTLTITYKGEFDIIVKTMDGAAISDRQAVEGSSGVVENVADENNSTTREAAFEIANAKLKKNSVISNTLRFSTHKKGLYAGQILTVNLPDYGLINQEMLIDKVWFKYIDNMWRYDVSCVYGPNNGSWTKMFEVMATRGQTFVVRENIREDEILIILESFSKTWEESDSPVNIFKEVYASEDLYPSDTLYPMFAPSQRVRYLELQDSLGNVILRKQITKQTGTETLQSITFVAPYEGIGSVAYVAWYGGYRAGPESGSGIEVDKQAWERDKTSLEAIQIDKTDIRDFTPASGTWALDVVYWQGIDDMITALEEASA